ncbi:MAG: tripartite tricarboxylate transporter substrate binding protein [Burkholderiales bacterium]|nr:tripartite tricarboxylate transporter substrate binding protein [Burkholderiales bacterium]
MQAWLMLLLTWTSISLGQGYPTRPIRVVNTVAAGGPAELVGRLLGQKFTEAWGQQVVVDSRPGAGGIIGASLVTRAAADGYTLLLASGATMVFAPLLQKETPYDPLKDFAFVSMIVKSPMVLVAHPSVPARTVSELAAVARAKPGYLNIGSLGTGSTPHLGSELLKLHAGIDIQHVSYKGGVAAVTALVAGEVQLLFNSTATALPHVKAGRLTLLGIGGTRRSTLMPDTPAIAETFPGFEVVTWYGVVAPAKTPPEIVLKLNAETSRALANRELADRLIAQGHEPDPGSPEDMRGYVKSELARWGKIVRAVAKER